MTDSGNRERYLVKLQGCDEINVAELYLTAVEAEFLDSVGILTRLMGNGYACRPVLTLIPYEHATAYDRETLDELHEERQGRAS